MPKIIKIRTDSGIAFFDIATTISEIVSESQIRFGIGHVCVQGAAAAMRNVAVNLMDAEK
ncbi:MAG: hypothetical protein JW861_02305 [Bacteroidales bacterium]|nr:hypothetical protein [Bacteroidales bacterium]